MSPSLETWLQGRILFGFLGLRLEGMWTFLMLVFCKLSLSQLCVYVCQQQKCEIGKLQVLNAMP